MDNTAQKTYWNERTGQSWVALQDRLDAAFAHVTAVAMEAAAPQPGERVLDVGCGCGGTVLDLARRVGPSGHVLGVDISEPMLAHAAARVAELALPHAALQLADAADENFSDLAADLVFSRFGVMFFADPAAAFANLRRALRPGGRLLCTAWRGMAESPFFTVPFDAAAPVLPPQPPGDPQAPGPFAFADAARVHGILQQAGWQDISITPADVALRVAAPDDLAAAAEFCTRIGAVARALADAPETCVAPVRAAVTAALRPLNTARGFLLGGSIWLISARTA